MNIVREKTMHSSYCEKWGITQEELDSTPESPATTAYGAYLLNIGLEGEISARINQPVLTIL